jgi:hypothetical protein
VISKQDVQIKSYFAKMIVRIIDKYNLRQESHSMDLLKVHSTMYSSIRERQIQSSVSALSGVLLRRYIKRWKKNLVTLTYMRKGFAIEKFFHLISKAMYCKPFGALMGHQRSLSSK